MHKKLTAYLSTLEADGFGKWIVDTESRGTVDNPIQMPYVSYSRMVKQFVNDVYVHIPDQTCQLHGEFPPGGRRKPATPPEGSASNGLCQP